MPFLWQFLCFPHGSVSSKVSAVLHEMSRGSLKSLEAHWLFALETFKGKESFIRAISQDLTDLEKEEFILTYSEKVKCIYQAIKRVGPG